MELLIAIAVLLLLGAFWPLKKRPYAAREKWLEASVPILLNERVMPHTMRKKPKVRIEVVDNLGRCGFLWRHTVLGLCKPKRRGVNIIMLTGKVSDGARLLDVVLHELIHAVDNGASGHGGHFKRVAKKAGLLGPMKRTTASPELQAYLSALAQRLGRVPDRDE